MDTATSLEIEVVRIGDAGPTPARPERAEAIRVAPLLALHATGAGAIWSTGRAEISVEGRHTFVRIVVDPVWTTGCPDGDDAGNEADGLLRRRIDTVLSFLADLDGDAPSRATAAAKAVAESSRNTVRDLSRYRSTIEGLVAGNLREHRPGSLSSVLGDLLALSVVGARALDHARDAAREGLWLWLDDAPTYHAYRKLQDPTLLVSATVALDVNARPWLRSLDAGIRQCRAIDQQLSQEATAVAQLTATITTITSARESESSQSFNTMLAVAAVGLGVPAMLLSLEATNALVPLRSSSQFLALSPILLVVVLAVLVAVRQMPGIRRRVALGAAGLFVLLLIGTALIAPGG